MSTPAAFFTIGTEALNRQQELLQHVLFHDIVWHDSPELCKNILFKLNQTQHKDA